MTVLDSWKFYYPKGPVAGDKSIPGISIPGSGSDFQVGLHMNSCKIKEVIFKETAQNNVQHSRSYQPVQVV